MIFDLVGIGAGPFNLSLGILLKDTALKSLFLDKKTDFFWHPGMKLKFATIQNSNLKDLISLVKPTSEYSFFNFLYETGRLESHIIANFSFTLRWEYEQYLQWVISKLDTVRMGNEVKHIKECEEGFEIILKNDSQKPIFAKNISVALGVKPLIPEFLENNLSERIFHNSEYQFHSKKGAKNILIVGGGQSALEIIIDLFNDKNNDIESITMVYREPFTHQMEDSQFAEDKIYTEMGLSNFYKLPSELKENLNKQYRFASDGASPHTIEEVYQMLYANRYSKIGKQIKFNIYSECSVCDVTETDKDLDIKVAIENIYSKNQKIISADMIILATGYKQYFPKEIFSDEILSKIKKDNNYNVCISEDYSLKYEGKGKIFYLNGGKHTHGVVDPNLSLNASRARKIVLSLDKTFPKPVKQDTIFGGII